ncbi:MAG: response regulator [Thermodesulfobacteria bacterium]|nr:response regulator [Thermodesulfobacteriota bacterium]
MESYKILLVDDEPVNLKILSAMLAPEGYEIHQAASGPEALSMVKEVQPDIVLLDVMMPEMDGFQVCQKLKQDEETRIIPVVMVTALQEKIHRQQAMEAGADDFISKPVDRIELIIRVKSLLRIKRYQDELLKNYSILKEKNRQLQEAERVKEGLTHMIIHDLRGPLTSISMNIDLSLMKLDPSAEIKKYLENAQQHCDYLDQMIQGLLDIYRMEEGKLDLNLSETDPRDLIHEVIEQLRPQMEIKKLTLDFKQPPDCPTLMLDRNLIKRVVANLLDNAVRHTPSQGQITIAIEPDPKEGVMTISVTDTGPGLDETYHDRIFDKFEQVKLKKKGVTSGSVGLGLAFCKMAVELHNGKIWLKNGSEDKGCTFAFSLPLDGPVNNMHMPPEDN